MINKASQLLYTGQKVNVPLLSLSKVRCCSVVTITVVSSALKASWVVMYV